MVARKHRLLIVEDHAQTRQALAKLFSWRGWTVTQAETIAEGLACLDTEAEPTLLILDLMLPDGSGEEVLRRVRSAGLGTHVVVSTATHDPARLAAVVGMGADAVLPKPIQVTDVFRQGEEAARRCAG